MKHIHPFSWYLMLTVVLLVPAGNDIYISAMPEIARVMNTTHTPMLLSVFIAGLGISQFFYGPLLDRFGRKPVLVVGLTIFVFASLFITFTNSFTLLVIGRFVQAIGACSTVSTILAVVKDRHDDKKMIAKNTAIVMSIIGVSPAIAPLIGSYATEMFNWRAPFAILLIMGVFYWFAVVFNHTETIREKNMHALRWTQIFGNYWKLISEPLILGYCLISAVSYGVLFSYLSLASEFLITQLHVSLTVFGYLIAANAFAILLMTLLAPKISNRIGFEKTLLVGLIIIMVGAIGMYITMHFFTPNMWSLTLTILVSFMGFGVVRPTGGAGVMHASPAKITGSAAALFSFSCFFGGAVATAIADFIVTTPVQFSYFTMVVTVIALLVAFWIMSVAKKA